MSSPLLQLETLFVFNDAGRIVSTREPGTNRCATFALIHGENSCAWGIRHDVPETLSNQINHLAQQEPPIFDLHAEPVNAALYKLLLGGQVISGPAFTFPKVIETSANTIRIEHVSALNRHFRGWTPEEIAERSPIMAIVVDGHAVSVCFCARKSAFAAEAGLETAEAFRGRGLGAKVTATWAQAVRAEGLTPLYSTSWTNNASLSVARKLNLMPYASDWSLLE